MFKLLPALGLDALPAQCAVCGAWPAQPVCAPCKARWFSQPARCQLCALPVPPGQTVCGACLREPPPVDACFAAVDYAYPWSRLITTFKFAGQPGWARALARLLLQVPPAAAAVAQADCLLPMPLARERLAERGFNQALELARRLARSKAEAHVLLRIRPTAPQTALNRAARLANVRGAFAVDPDHLHRVRGQRVVVVDDVMTSGASLFSAAQALRAAGAAHITALAVARTDEWATR